MNCPKWGYYCDGQRIEDEGTKQKDWKACARSCNNNFACNYWHFYVKEKRPVKFAFKCFLYTNCKYQMDFYFPEIQNVAGNRNCTSNTGPSKLSFNINYVYSGNFLSIIDN